MNCNHQGIQELLEFLCRWLYLFMESSAKKEVSPKQVKDFFSSLVDSTTTKEEAMPIINLVSIIVNSAKEKKRVNEIVKGLISTDAKIPPVTSIWGSDKIDLFLEPYLLKCIGHFQVVKDIMNSQPEKSFKWLQDIFKPEGGILKNIEAVEVKE